MESQVTRRDSNVVHTYRTQVLRNKYSTRCETTHKDTSYHAQDNQMKQTGMEKAREQRPDSRHREDPTAYDHTCSTCDAKLTACGQRADSAICKPTRKNVEVIATIVATRCLSVCLMSVLSVLSDMGLHV